MMTPMFSQLKFPHMLFLTDNVSNTSTNKLFASGRMIILCLTLPKKKIPGEIFFI